MSDTAYANTGGDFATRFFELAECRSPLCLGLDPSEDLLRRWGLDDSIENLHRFCQTVLDAAGDRVAVIKPQAGFFERLGHAGMAVMAQAVSQAKSQGSLVLIDAKRGDFERTMSGYAQAMVGDGSGFGGDAVTLTAYLGLDALRPVLDRAAVRNGAAFIVVRSSNRDGHALQNARHADGRTVAEALADSITDLNSATGKRVGHIGAVVGATIEHGDAAILVRMPNSLILAPGIGAQGATFAALKAKFGTHLKRTLPSASRSILEHGPDVKRLRDAINQHCNEAGSAYAR